MKPYYQDKYATIYHGDCLELLPEMPKVDLVLTDPPYGITSIGWDNELDFELFWSFVGSGQAVVFSCQPFTSKLVCSNLANFKYEIIWEKDRPSNFPQANVMPLRYHENICIFYKECSIYNKQPEKRSAGGKSRCGYVVDNSSRNGENVSLRADAKRFDPDNKNPKSIQPFSMGRRQDSNHPTQKPIDLMVWLVKTFSNHNTTIIDPFMGSGTTLLAAKQLNRQAIGIEIEEKYCEIAAQRLSQEVFDFS